MYPLSSSMMNIDRWLEGLRYTFLIVTYVVLVSVLNRPYHWKRICQGGLGKSNASSWNIYCNLSYFISMFPYVSLFMIVIFFRSFSIPNFCHQLMLCFHWTMMNLLEAAILGYSHLTTSHGDTHQVWQIKLM